MAPVIMGYSLTTSLSERQARLGVVKRLYLALLLEAEDQCMGGGVKRKRPTMSVSFLRNALSFESLNCRHRSRLRPWAFQTLCTLEPAGPGDLRHRT